jgi:hypothetical protein
MRARRIALICCLVAALRVFVFSAAFPFFNNVDEQAHVDLVLKYARAHPPRSLENFGAESGHYFVECATPEYFTPPQTYGGTYPPPNWTRPPSDREQLFQRDGATWQSMANHESGEPPLYYAIAGAWLNLGRALRFEGAALLYWVRFLNVFFAAALVWIGYRIAAALFEDRQFTVVATAALLAVWPQSVLYSIESDALSPLCFAVTLLAFVRLWQAQPPRIAIGAIVGLALAATCLTKTANLPLVFVMSLAMLWFLARNRMSRPALLAFAAFTICVAIPLSAWFAWNLHTFGDLIATRAKIDMLGWTRKPIALWWPHPIFSLAGVKEFFSELFATFWRGEFIWHGERLASAALDAFFAICSASLLLITIATLFTRHSTNIQRSFLWICALSFAALVAFLIFLSIAFDFGDCPYPSRAHPFFTSGRLLSAAAVPFFLLCAHALDWLGRITKRAWLSSFLLVAIVAIALVSQVLVNAPAFASRYNFFHLLAR